MMTSNSAHILVVDDAPLTRGLLEQALRKYGYRVDTAQNGQQAIDYFLAHHPDLILMDANMPVLDGISACARIKALPEAKYLPILIVTALMEREWVDRAYAAGATDYITKPVNLDVLRNRIHYILQAKQAEEALFDEKEKAQITLASICDGVITTDAKGQVEYLNPVATNLTGWTTQAAQGLPLNSVFCIIDEKTQQPVDIPMDCCLEEGKQIKIKNPILLHRDRINRFAIEDSGAPIRDRHGKVIGAVLVFNDVTEKRKMTQALAYRATHDALTGLYNRDEFNLQLELMLQAPRDNNTEHALLYMDLDQFKIVNDTCGHEAGDQLLKDVSFLMKKKIEA
ncbi:MAG TPA: GGDEF domain-containing response regulator, partial [Thiotrichaceae bacterium]|nr:GGDEF domain-containing response regulator [Thiotrichaceae bacterium]